MIEYIDAKKAMALMDSEATCIFNIVTAWCGDCTKQAENFNRFASDFIKRGISVYEINVQNEPHQYISAELETLTRLFGGIGFPRTVLIQNGKVVDADNVEVISADDLSVLAKKLSNTLHFS